MISRTNRFHGQASLRRLQQRGDTARSGVFSLRYAPNDRRTQYRLAVVVSRKVSKSAVVRNRIRRRLYETVRILFNDQLGAYDLALSVYDEKIATLPIDAVQLEITKLLRKAHIATVPAPRHAIVEERRKT